MPHVTDLTEFHFIEGSTPQLDYTLLDENGNVILVSLDTQVASIYDESSRAVVPNWTDLDIKGAEGNLVVDGIGVWTLPATATVKINSTDEYEIHIISMKFTYGGTKIGIHHIRVKIYRA